MLVTAYAQEDAVRAAMQAQLDAPKIRSIMNQEIDGEPSSMTTEYVAPDLFRMVMPDTEMIVIGSTTYQKEAGDAWQILDMDMGAMISEARQSGMVESVTYSDVQALPDETLDGKACAVYRYTTTFEGTISQNKLWVEKSTGLPLQLDSEGDFLGAKSKTTIHYEYDSSLEITAPI